MVGLKAGLAIGSLFGPLGTIIGPIAGALYCQWQFMQRTLDADAPIQQAAKDAARLFSAGSSERTDVSRERSE